MCLGCGKERNAQPSCFFVKLEGAFDLTNSPEIYLGFDRVTAHACLSVAAVWHYFSSDGLEVQEGL